MKKIIFSLFMIGIVFSILGYKQVSAKDFNQKHSEARIISANYQGTKLILELEIERERYTGQFYQPLSHDDYLFLHHNVGTTIEVDYIVEPNHTILIYNWESRFK
jgi:hypothetical protein